MTLEQVHDALQTLLTPTRVKRTDRVALCRRIQSAYEYAIAERKAPLVLHATRLIVDERGRALRRDGLRYRFDAARAKSGVAFQFRDLRAKAATDKAEAQDMRQAQRQLGHASVVMTEAYVRARRGDKVTPTR